MFSETWFTEDSCPIIPGFTLYRKDRLKRIGGGVCIYINSRFNSYLFSEKELGIVNPAVETIWCVVKVGGESVLVGCVYRPGDSSRQVGDQIDLGISRAKKLVDSKKFTGLLIAGDFNYWQIEWPGCENLPPGPALNFKDMLDDNFITQHVQVPTFQIDDGLPSNTLDLVLTENFNRIPGIEVDHPLGNIAKAHLILKWRYYLNNQVECNANSVNPLKSAKKKLQ